MRTRGTLPHWELDRAIYFVTFRTKGSLPKQVVLDLMLERKRLLEKASESEKPSIEWSFFRRYDEELDKGRGSLDPALIAHALRHFDCKRYILHAWCVMPNHVHALFQILRGRDLAKIVHSWKSYTAHAGAIEWHREYYDHLIRDERELQRTVEYIRANPAAVGLRDWKWVWPAN